MPTYHENQTVFVKHPEHSWVKGTILSKQHNNSRGRGRATQGEYSYTVQVAHDDSSITVHSQHSLYPYRPEDILRGASTTDLLNLIDLHEATLLNCLKTRFFNDEIYTYIGPICIAMNPFKWSIPWYQPQCMQQYIDQKPSLRPHFWEIADDAFRDMQASNRNHSLLVSGNSGSGKSETCKQLLEYLGQLSCHLLASDPQSNAKRTASLISERIRQSSPILEAFGNAKTINNDNSSRFGKFIKLQFDKNGLILGAHITNYLLEKSRLIQQAPEERSFHIFYQFLAGATDEQLEKYKLTRRPGDYKCIIGGYCTHVDSIDDLQDWKDTKRAMNILNLSQQEQDNVLRIVAAVMHLQNIEFGSNEDEHAQVNKIQPLQDAASLLGLGSQRLEKTMLTKTRVIMKKEIVSPNTAEKAADVRNTITKALYSSLFDWLIFKINSQLTVDSYDKFIGLLDIFGFETFDVNSFEQLCINFANETLQYHYNDYNFKRDIKECRDEGIDVSSVKFRDNTPCVELIQGSRKQPGVLQLLDEQCTFPRSTDKTFLNLISKQFASHKHFSLDKLKHDEFFVKHFAGQVEYNVDSWLEKNKDELKPDILHMLRSSSNPFISSLVKDPPIHNRKPLTVGGSFRMQLTDLLRVINSTTPHWIRCIKSHPSKKPDSIHGDEVMTQLLASGVLESIKIRREGFCFRIALDEFYSKYSVIIHKSPNISASELASACQSILDAMDFTEDEAQVGKTKVFLRIDPYSKLKEERNKRLENSILTLQKYARMQHAKNIVTMMYRKTKMEENRKRLAAHKKRISILQTLKKEKEYIEEEVQHQIQRDNDIISRMKEDTARRMKILEVQHLKNEVLRKERMLAAQKKREEEARLQKERAQMLEKLRLEREMQEKKRREQEMAEWLEKERQRQEEEAREAAQRQLEWEKQQQLALVKKRQKRIRERQAKLEALRMERERIDRIQQEGFLRAKQQFEEERYQKEMEKREAALQRRKKQQVAEDVKRRFAELERQRIEELLDQEEEQDNIRRKKETAKRAYIEYVRKLKYKEVEERAKELQQKEERSSEILENIKQQQKMEVEEMSRRRNMKFRRVRERQEEIESLMEQHKERIEMQDSLQQISDEIRENLLKKRRRKRVQKEWEHRRILQSTEEEFKKAVDRKLYEKEMEHSRRREQRRLTGGSLSPRMSSPTTRRMLSPRRHSSLARPMSPSSRRPLSPRSSALSPRRVRISTKIEGYSPQGVGSPRRNGSRRSTPNGSRRRRSPARSPSPSPRTHSVASSPQILPFGSPPQHSGAAYVTRGQFSMGIK